MMMANAAGSQDTAGGRRNLSPSVVAQKAMFVHTGLGPFVRRCTIHCKEQLPQITRQSELSIVTILP